MKESRKVRIQSIDVLRALTMFFMIFVNDLWSLSGVPEWLQHTQAEEDGMGFSDVIFPLFLFIVGLSIPLAIHVRLQKGDTTAGVALHIISRTLALLVMGFFMVNFEYLNPEATGISKYLWEFLMALGIFLIWMDYKRTPLSGTVTEKILRGLGLFLLGFLAVIYRSGEPENPAWMQVHWWGILGLIGWAYVLNSLIYLWLRKHQSLLFFVFLLFAFMNVQENALFESLPAFRIVISASNHMLVMGGVLCTVVLLRLKDQRWKFTSFALAGSLLLIVYGFVLRPQFPISKILATPSWTAICLGIGFLCFLLLFWIVDQGGYTQWAHPIKAAGTSTLTCYLLPYFIYPLLSWSGVTLPAWFTTGIPGLIKSLLLSLSIILLVGVMENRKIRLKV